MSIYLFLPIELFDIQKKKKNAQKLDSMIKSVL